MATNTDPSLLRRPGLRTLLAAEVISTFGTQLTGLALPWFVLTTTGSATKAGLVLVAETVPVVLVGLLSGSWAERLGARRTMLVSDTCRAPLVAAIPLLAFVDALPFALLLGVVFVIGSFYAPYTASQQVMLSELVGPDEQLLARATSVLQSATRLTLLLGPPAAGLMIAVVSAPVVLLVDATSYLLVVILIATRIPHTNRRNEPTPGGMLTGLRTLYRSRLLGSWTTASILGEAAYQALFLAIPVLVLTKYHQSATLAGILIGAFGGGALVGSLLAARLILWQPARRLALIGKTAQPLVFGVLILALPSSLLAGALFVLGVANGLSNGPSFAVRITQIPAPLRTKALTAAATITMLGATAGLAAAGPALDHLNANTVVGVMAVLQLASAVLFIVGYLPGRQSQDQKSSPESSEPERMVTTAQHQLEP